MMRSDELSLFLSGLFFGGAIDHTILAVTHAKKTPYGLSASAATNCAFAVFDLGLAAALYGWHRRAARNRAVTGPLTLK
jgi:hypothetical protein